MPTERFYNLPEEKRRRIIRAAVDELARVPCEQVSINRIIRAAGIPRGSFYQYFADKRDLLGHVMQGFAGEMRSNVKQWLKACDGDIFCVFETILDYTVDFGTREGHYAFCRNAFTQVRMDRQSLSDIVPYDAGELVEEFRPYARMDRLRLQTPGQAADFIEMMALLLHRAITRIFADMEQRDEIKRRYMAQLEMLKSGVYKREDEP